MLVYGIFPSFLFSQNLAPHTAETLCFLNECIRTGLKKSTFFWDITPYGLMKVKQYFEGTFCFNFQDRRTNQKRNQHETDSKRAQLMLLLWRWRRDVPLQNRLTVRTLIHAWFINATWLTTVSWVFLGSSFKELQHFHLHQSIFHSLKLTIPYIHKLDIHEWLKTGKLEWKMFPLWLYAFNIKTFVHNSSLKAT
jgi:hypothetical protein